MATVSRTGKIGILVGLLALLSMVGGYYLAARMHPKTDLKLNSRVVESTFNDLPAGCPTEFRPYAQADHSDLTLFAIEDRSRITRGYVFASSPKRWGDIEKMPEWFRVALESSTVLVGARSDKEIDWHDGYAPKSTHRLKTLLNTDDQTGLEERFDSCRLGGFWPDMHASYALDLVDYCAKQTMVIEEITERHENAARENKCNLNAGLKRFSLNNRIEYRAIETENDRMRIYEKGSPREIRGLLEEMLSKTDHAIADLPVFTLQDAEASLQKLARKTPMQIEVLIEASNMQWADNMLEMMRREIPFFMIDAHHLPGSRGLLSLLKKKGYKFVQLGS